METPNLRVRELRRKDIPAVIELFQGSFPRELEVMGFNPETVRKQLRLYGLARLVQRLTRKPFVLFWVGEVAGEIVATVTLTRKRGSWYISTVMVAPEHRRRGYGRAMVEHALGVIRTQGGRRAVLHVLEDNLPAKRLYEGAGFSRFERVVHLVREPPEAGESPLPQGYRLVRIGMFDPRAAQLTYAAMEPDSAEVYGPPQVPPWYLQALARRQPGVREPQAVVREGEWVGVYSFSAPFGTKGAASAGISLLPEHRGLGLEEALLSLALARARELGCPRLLVRANEANGALLSACERLGFTRLYAMEGMYRDL
jgi:ribosomal protein S18 acetylase RimI-like enzyme